MEYSQLGNTGIKVSRLCFGGLTVGPLQANLPSTRGGEIIAHAFSRGVNFIDTAELYQTYPHIKHALKLYKGDIVIASKTYAFTKEVARASVEKTRSETGRDVIDIFLLHEQESKETLQGHMEALEELHAYKARGIIRAVGMSTHHIAAVRAAATMPEIEVIHPIVNHAGIGIADGGIQEMIKEVEIAYNNGKGIYAMKPLGGGTLISNVDKCFEFVLSLPFTHSIALGMQSEEEVEANILRFEGKEIPKELSKKLSEKQRKLHIDFWCKGCGKCVDTCKIGALSVHDGKAIADPTKCVLCGYCASSCPDFAIKVV